MPRLFLVGWEQHFGKSSGMERRDYQMHFTKTRKLTISVIK